MRNLCKPHFRNIACGKADGVQGVRCSEIDRTSEIVNFKVILSINTKTGHHHICHAVCYSLFVGLLNFFIAHSIEKAAVCVNKQVAEIVCDVIFNSILCSTHNGRAEVFAVFKLAEGVFERINDILCVFVLHFPNRDRTGVSAAVGVRYIKVMGKSLSAAVFICKHSDTVRSFIYPPPKAFVPSLNFQNCCSIRSLCVNQQLLVKSQTEVIAGGAKKSFPIFRSRYDRFTFSVVHLRYEVIFPCHWWLPPYLS
ncbi:hypothetical protein LI142_13565 [Eubacterium limosum]|uniref:hypothetical protein n=1 Tax=Eubacterium limosum TaxID=1736 RepID=UPI001D08B205|nr:hypothetical protein [Eubacterium limosum]MCB6570527.1 hypothetical protein [Eubacterium limosum]